MANKEKIAQHLDKAQRLEAGTDAGNSEEESLLAEIRHLRSEVDQLRTSKLEKSRKQSRNEKIAVYLDRMCSS
ncbi:hypothetical protein [Microbulbifer sp. MCCC 1A16149]|uniref:hypothetical protein n=1 Tax=Microbulbifer sp. MCCC 1A16149 TaxID=3411322 RepID=UPI003D14FB42